MTADTDGGFDKGSEHTFPLHFVSPQHLTPEESIQAADPQVERSVSHDGHGSHPKWSAPRAWLPPFKWGTAPAPLVESSHCGPSRRLAGGTNHVRPKCLHKVGSVRVNASAPIKRQCGG